LLLPIITATTTPPPKLRYGSAGDQPQKSPGSTNSNVSARPQHSSTTNYLLITMDKLTKQSQSSVDEKHYNESDVKRFFISRNNFNHKL
jgi:hypothetical protein